MKLAATFALADLAKKGKCSAIGAFRI